MPADHIRQWHHNRAFLRTIEPEFPDWAVTVSFYTALHAVDALLKHDKVPGIVSHETRNATLGRTNRYKKIWKVYQPLYDLSRTIRYLARPARWVAWEKVEGEVFRRYLYPLEASVQKLMGKQEQLPRIEMKAPPASAIQGEPRE